MTDHCQALERLLHHDIQLTRAMQLQVLSWQAHELRLRLPLQANSNHHHSMFGGSLYSAAVLAGLSPVAGRWSVDPPVRTY